MPSNDVRLESEVLRSLIVETKDGEWGSGESGADAVAMRVIRGTDFDDARHLDLSAVPVRHIAQRHAARKTLRVGDVLIETAGGSKGRPTGRTVFLREGLFRSSDLPITCASFARFMRFDASRVDPEFVYWWLQSVYQSGQIERYQVQHSGIARFQFTKFADEVRVPLPERGVQEFVAETLGTIERRVTLLRQTNTTRESIAQALFKSWFIDFDPVRAKAEGREPEGMDAATAALFPAEFEESPLGLIPKGWRAGLFGDIAEQAKGSVNPLAAPDVYFEHYSLPAFDADQLPVFERGDAIKSNKTRVPADSVLQSKLNPHIPRVWMPSNVGENAVCSTEFVPWVARRNTSRELVYCTLTAPVFEASVRTLVTGTSNSHQRVKPDQIATLDLVVAPGAVRDSFTKIVRPLLAKVGENRWRSKSLADLRDTLLPRLISGKLRLPEVREQLEEALA